MSTSQIVYLAAFVAAMLSLMAWLAGATPRAVVLAPEPPDPANVLVAGPHPVPHELVDQALRMPAVQAGMRQMELAGFVRAPELDGECVTAGRPGAAITYRDPAHPAYTPAVVVVSETASPEARTWVGGAVFAADPATNNLTIVSGVLPGDAFTIGIGDMASTRPGNYVVASDFRDGFMKWLKCSGEACAASLAACSIVGALTGPGVPAVVLGCTIAACATGAWLCL